MFIFICGYNAEYYRTKCEKNNNIIVSDYGLNIDSYEIINPDIIIYIYNINDNKNIKYEIKFDINCPYPLFKINGIDDSEYILKCLNTIIQNHS